MAITLSERYSTLVDTKTRATLVLKDGVIFNNRYEGNVKAGAVKVRKSGAVTVSDYDPVTGTTMTEGTSSYITIPINKNKAINEIIDGYTAAAVPDGLVADRLDQAGYDMALLLDKDGAADLVSEGTKLSNTTALTKSTVYKALVDARTTLSKAGVPQEGRYVIVDPDIMGLILQSDEFIRASDLGDAVVQTGAVGKIAGFLVFESNSFVNVTEGEGAEAVTYKTEFVAGHPDFATRVNEFSVPVHVQSLDQSGKWIGACAVQGRKVYGHKVTNPACILVKRTAA